MQDLIDGYYRFRAGRYVEQHRLYSALEAGQAPQTMIVSCCDSRVDPSTIFDAAPGNLFIVRNVANLVPPCETLEGHHGTSAAVEFAVTGLKVSRILVLGHAACGGIAACLNHDFASGAEDSFILRWMSILAPTRDKLLEERKASGFAADDDAAQEALEKAGVLASLENLKTFPFVRAAIEGRGLALEGAHFGIGSGKLTVLHPEAGEFVEVPDQSPGEWPQT